MIYLLGCVLLKNYSNLGDKLKLFPLCKSFLLRAYNIMIKSIGVAQLLLNVGIYMSPEKNTNSVLINILVN